MSKDIGSNAYTDCFFAAIVTYYLSYTIIRFALSEVKGERRSESKIIAYSDACCKFIDIISSRLKEALSIVSKQYCAMSGLLGFLNPRVWQQHEISEKLRARSNESVIFIRVIPGERVIDMKRPLPFSSFMCRLGKSPRYKMFRHRRRDVLL